MPEHLLHGCRRCRALPVLRQQAGDYLPYGQGATSYVEGVPTLYLSSATCRCQGCTAEIDGPQRKSIIEGEDEYNACIAALKTWNNRFREKGK